jgi:hypothetical protein
MTSSQYFTPSTGQRAYTLADIVNSMNDQLNGVDDSSLVPDAGEIINVFANVSSEAAYAQDVVLTTTQSPQSWDTGVPYAQGAWS